MNTLDPIVRLVGLRSSELHTRWRALTEDEKVQVLNKIDDSQLYTDTECAVFIPYQETEDMCRSLKEHDSTVKLVNQQTHSVTLYTYPHHQRPRKQKLNHRGEFLFEGYVESRYLDNDLIIGSVRVTDIFGVTRSFHEKLHSFIDGITNVERTSYGSIAQRPTN